MTGRLRIVATAADESRCAPAQAALIRHCPRPPAPQPAPCTSPLPRPRARRPRHVAVRASSSPRAVPAARHALCRSALALAAAVCSAATRLNALLAGCNPACVAQLEPPPTKRARAPAPPRAPVTRAPVATSTAALITPAAPRTAPVCSCSPTVDAGGDVSSECVHASRAQRLRVPRIVLHPSSNVHTHVSLLVSSSCTHSVPLRCSRRTAQARRAQYH